jgi:cytochrome P450
VYQDQTEAPLLTQSLTTVTTFDVMGDLTFGESLHMLDDSKYDPWVSIIFGSIKFGSRFNLLTYYPWLSRFVKANIPAKMQKKKYEHFQYSVERVSKRLERGRTTEGRDLWDYALNQEESKSLSRGEMDANATLFMLAGTETTATLLSGLTYLLLKNPSKMAALSEEIRGAFENEKDMSMEAIAALPYLAACLKEALRLYPPVPVGLPHLTPANGSTICGRFIPPGVCVASRHLDALLTWTR